MLSRLETMSINPNIKLITDAVNEQDFDKMKAKIHNMKGACGYVGASRLHYVCAFIQEEYLKGNFKKMLDHYPRLIESIIEYRRYSRRLLSE